MIKYSSAFKILKKSPLVILCGLGILFSSCDNNEATERTVDGLPEVVDFNFHVKPILSDRCFACHGPDVNRREAGLRLDIPEGAYASLEDRKNVFAIVKGKPHKSEIYNRIISDDPDFQMPPPESNLTLSDREKAIIKKWIEQGAEYKPHWSFIAPEKADLPEVKNKEWAKTPIDRFVLAKMEAQGLSPSPEASKEQLIRRVSFDLTGLPPTPQEVDGFLADKSQDAYEKVVDRLLASPHYGERMAVEWLDAGRYADTHGYQDDGMRNSWPWRNWVIDAYNKNLPYDQFITWQLAGDLMPKPSKEQLIATSFNRNHPQTQEGGVVDEEYRVEYVADRTNTLGKAIMGVSLECARCHDHKYDPISQKDYFSLFAFFNNNNESGIIPYNGEASPTILLTDEEAEAKIKFLREQMKPHEENLRKENYREDFKKWLAHAEKSPEKFGVNEKHLLGWFSFEEAQEEINLKNNINKPLKARVAGDMDKKPVVVPGKEGNGRKFIGDAGIDFSKELDFDRHQPFSISIWVNVLEEGEEGTLFAKCNGEFEGYRGYRCLINKDNSLSVSLSYVWPANCIDLKIEEKLIPKQWYHLTLTYDGSSKAEGVNFYINGKEAKREVIVDNLHKSLLYGENKTNWSKLPFMLGKDFRGSISNIVMDELKAYDRQLSALEVREIATGKPQIAPLLAMDASKRSSAQEEALFQYYLLNFDKNYENELSRLTLLRAQENEFMTDIPELMIMSERKDTLPAFLLDRGAYDAPTEQVFPGTPESLPALQKNLPKNRLGLSRWLFSKEHPLTSRVAVNKLWKYSFGKGLVATVDDFGSQGALPSHPELLDWLAVHFRESGWDVKAFMKMLVMSNTYRQSSVPSPESLETDPENIWYSRSPSYRLSAEMIRDNALKASGLLVEKIGGKSVYPYQPDGIWEALATRNATHYTQGKGEDLYRRSLYTIWKRSSPPPSMMNFDAPDRYFCTVDRQKTSTPLQALVLMNDPQYVEAARKLGERMMKEGGITEEERISFAYKALVSRNPRPQEMELMKSFYKEELQDFIKNPDRAKELLSTGEAAVDKHLDEKELAACTIIASALMNFDEFVVKR